MGTITYKITFGLLVVVAVALIAWDFVVATNQVKGDTISEILQHFAYKHPFIPFGFGVLAGHFFWLSPHPTHVVFQVATLATLSAFIFVVDLLSKKTDIIIATAMVNSPASVFLFGFVVGHLVWPIGSLR